LLVVVVVVPVSNFAICFACLECWNIIHYVTYLFIIIIHHMYRHYVQKSKLELKWNLQLELGLGDDGHARTHGQSVNQSVPDCHFARVLMTREAGEKMCHTRSVGISVSGATCAWAWTFKCEIVIKDHPANEMKMIYRDPLFHRSICLFTAWSLLILILKAISNSK